MAGTDPGNVASVLKAASAPDNGGGVKVRFDSVEGRLYRVDYRDTLTSAWIELSSGIAGTGSVIEVVDSSGSPSRVYRVEVELE